MWTPLRNQHGQAMIAMGIGLVVFLGMAALAIDIAHVAFTATEVQTAADAAATAAASALSQVNGGGPAIATGQTVAANNKVAGNAVSNLVACPGDPNNCIDLGTWGPDPANPATLIFTHRNTAPYNAAQATVTVTVPNIVAFGEGTWIPTSTMTKVATAAIRPSLPFALGIGSQCQLNQTDPAISRFDPLDCAGNPGPVTLQLGNQGEARDAKVTWANFVPDGGVTQYEVLAFMPPQCTSFNQFGDSQPGGGQLMPVLDARVDAPPFNTFAGYEGGVVESALWSCVCTTATSPDLSCPHSEPLIKSFTVPFFTCDPANYAPSFAQAVNFGVIKIDWVSGNPLDPDLSNPPTIQVTLLCDAPSNQVALVQ